MRTCVVRSTLRIWRVLVKSSSPYQLHKATPRPWAVGFDWLSTKHLTNTHLLALSQWHRTGRCTCRPTLLPVCVLCNGLYFLQTKFPVEPSPMRDCSIPSCQPSRRLVCQRSCFAYLLSQLSLSISTRATPRRYAISPLSGPT